MNSEIKKENVIKVKSFQFSLIAIRLYKFLFNQKEFTISRQFLRSATAIGALVREAEEAESKADFAHKMAIALKESNETEYWLELLIENGKEEESFRLHTLQENYLLEIKDKNKELIRILTSIIKTSRNRVIK